MSLFFDGKLSFKKELALLLKNEGFRWVALRSTDLTAKCTECNRYQEPQYSDSPGFCTKCLGTGHLFVDKLVKTYSYLATPGLDLKSMIGNINTTTMIFIFESDQKPKTSDYILELDTDPLTMIPKQPYSITKYYKINDADFVRDLNGEIQFFRCYTEELNLDEGGSII